MGRNMFDPGRGDRNADWKGWWGDDPPYHAPIDVSGNELVAHLSYRVVR
jgi:hypothetical protein